MAESIDSPAVIAALARIVDDAREAGCSVRWVQHADVGLVKGGDGWQIVPTPDEPIIHKMWGGAFVETDLADRLAECGMKRVILCGAQTDACIRSTFYGGIYRSYDMTLVEDAHTTAATRGHGLPYGPPEEAIRGLNVQAAWTKPQRHLPDDEGRERVSRSPENYEPWGHGVRGRRLSLAMRNETPQPLTEGFSEPHFLVCSVAPIRWPRAGLAWPPGLRYSLVTNPGLAQ